MPSPETVYRPVTTGVADVYSATATGTLPSGSPPPTTPLQRVGPYQLIERIGRGGLGDVYRALHTLTGDVVALKLLRGGGEATPAELRSFRRELETARRLSHPGILPILDAGTHDGTRYYTMPLVRGGSLDRRLRCGPFGHREGADLLARVARAVSAAHQRGIVHRDLKPANVLLADDGSPLVADFGLARFVDQLTAHTVTGQLMGSLPYMAPEQAAGRSHHATAATDVWALGVILYEILTGERPFHGESHTDVLHRIQFDEPAPPAGLRGDAPAALEAVCLRCLRKSPSERYASAGELADDLQRWLTGEPVKAVRPKAPRPWLPLLAAAAVLFVLTGLTAAPTAAPVSPDAVSSEQAARAKLARHLAAASPGRPVELLSSERRPLWGRIVVGEDQTKTTYRRGQLPWLHTPNRCLIELLPRDPNRGDYRLSIEFTMEGAGPTPLAGLYAGHSQTARPKPGGGTLTVHAFAEAVFPVPGRKEPVVGLNFTGFVVYPDGNVGSHNAQVGLHVELPGQLVPARHQVRSFAIEVRRHQVGIAAVQPTAWPSPARQQIALGQLAGNAELAGALPELSPGAPAGIVLRSSGVRVHRVLYEPLPASR